MQLREALFNWLQIHLVSESRPVDRSAQDTVRFFEKILEEDHEVTQLGKKLVSESFCYKVSYIHKEKECVEEFPANQAEKLLTDILSEPRYNQSYE